MRHLFTLDPIGDYVSDGPTRTPFMSNSSLTSLTIHRLTCTFGRVTRVHKVPPAAGRSASDITAPNVTYLQTFTSSEKDIIYAYAS
jgi:hypothetical protein